jgi:SNF2 family DNA or RNA helicase
VVLNLLPYQEEGFGWIVAQEEEEEAKAKLSEEGQGTGSSAKGKTKATAAAMKAAEESNAAARPVTSVRGGILADEMGMGKTLQTICLFCHDKEQAAVAAAMVPKDKGKGKAKLTSAAAAAVVAASASPSLKAKTVIELPKEPLPGPTLVVAPSSAMWQWHDEVLRSVAPGALKVAMFYGGARNVLDLDAYDVVITTYPVKRKHTRGYSLC